MQVIVKTPCNGVFTITCNISDSGVIEVWDEMGRKILSEPIKNNVMQTVNLSAFCKGVYYVQLTQGAGNSVVKRWWWSRIIYSHFSQILLFLMD